ncbi:MAG TPA: NUDIX domain-containing protein [Candidatus Moranbacteria bacterium]|nr:NUDIX domain-containing protein [Candidatus Moranbacteria bacterium]
MFDAKKANAGWKPGDDSVIENPKLGCKVVHVMWVSPEGDKVLYDQAIRAEKGGGVFLPVDEKGRVGLKKVWRPQTNDQEAYARNFPNINLSELGRFSYEIPRGFPKMRESGHEAAIREAKEETESVVVSARNLGRFCDNTAFSPHLTDFVVGQIDMSRSSGLTADQNDQLMKGVEWFTWEELIELRKEGKLYCCFTLSALAIIKMEYPELLK